MFKIKDNSCFELYIITVHRASSYAQLQQPTKGDPYCWCTNVESTDEISMLALIFLVKLPGGWDVYSQEGLLNLK